MTAAASGQSMYRMLDCVRDTAASLCCLVPLPACLPFEPWLHMCSVHYTSPLGGVDTNRLHLS
jgi:hypothetical protein